MKQKSYLLLVESLFQETIDNPVLVYVLKEMENPPGSFHECYFTPIFRYSKDTFESKEQDTAYQNYLKNKLLKLYDKL